MSNVVPLLRCKLCGNAGSPRTLELNEEAVAGLVGCDACIEECTLTMDSVRPVFDAMIAAGIDREVANDTMTYMLQRAKL